VRRPGKLDLHIYLHLNPPLTYGFSDSLPFHSVCLADFLTDLLPTGLTFLIDTFLASSPADRTGVLVPFVTRSF
jgi:hypothetical protein